MAQSTIFINFKQKIITHSNSESKVEKLKLKGYTPLFDIDAFNFSSTAMSKNSNSEFIVKKVKDILNG